jgi:very-short-patch-repair endonuclease
MEEGCLKGGVVINLELPPPTPSLKRRGAEHLTMKTINNIKKFYYRRKELRNNSTPQEILLWLHLKDSKLGFKFRRQHSLGGYIADFYCPSKKLVIEIDGSQHFINKKYDDIRSSYLQGLDIKVVRFTNNEINTNISGVIDNIIKYLN